MYIKIPFIDIVVTITTYSVHATAISKQKPALIY